MQKYPVNKSPLILCWLIYIGSLCLSICSQSTICVWSQSSGWTGTKSHHQHVPWTWRRNLPWHMVCLQPNISRKCWLLQALLLYYYYDCSSRHTVPDDKWKEAQGKDSAWYHRSLKDGSPVIIYLHGRTQTRYQVYLYCNSNRISKYSKLVVSSRFSLKCVCVQTGQPSIALEWSTWVTALKS